MGQRGALELEYAKNPVHVGIPLFLRGALSVLAPAKTMDDFVLTLDPKPNYHSKEEIITLP